MVTPAWGIPAERYEERYIYATKHSRVPDVVPVWVPIIGRDIRVLDLGCGTGWQARQLVDQGCTVVGVEFDTKAAARATPWCERVIVCDLDLVDLPTELGPDSFDAVAAGDILEHLRDPARLLRSLTGVLNPGGRVVASIPNVAHGSVRLALLTGAFPYEHAGILDRTHLRFFTLASIQELFESSGFEIEQLERVELSIDAATPYDRALLAPGVEEAVAAMPEATTFQFVVVARPVSQAPVHTSASTEGMGGTGGTGGTGDHDQAKGERDQRDVLLAAQSDALRALEETIFRLRKETGDLEQQLAEIECSRVWRLWGWLRSRPILVPLLARCRQALSRTSASRPRSSRS